MRAAFAGWMQKITFVVRTQQVVDALVTSVDKNVTFRGTLQPLNPKAIMLKPEGQRAWTWFQLHCQSPGARFNVNDQVIYDGRKFKVMAENDYSLNGYFEYHLVQDYQP